QSCSTGSSGRRCNRGGTNRDTGWWCGSRISGKFRKLRQSLPTGHPFAPTEIGGNETPGTQSLVNFCLRKNTQNRTAAIDMNVRHDYAFYLTGERKSIIRCDVIESFGGYKDLEAEAFPENFGSLIFLFLVNRGRARNTTPPLIDKAAIFHPDHATVSGSVVF